MQALLPNSTNGLQTSRHENLGVCEISSKALANKLLQKVCTETGHKGSQSRVRCASVGVVQLQREALQTRWMKDHGKGVPGRSDSLPRPGDVRAWHISGRQRVFRKVPFSLGTGPEEGSENKGLPKHQAERQGLCPGAVGVAEGRVSCGHRKTSLEACQGWVGGWEGSWGVWWGRK